MKKVFIIPTVAFFVLASCSRSADNNSNDGINPGTKKNSTPCESGSLPYKSLETEYGCTNTKYQLHISLQDTFAVIKNQADFFASVSGSCLPTIDFTNYDLIIGKKGLKSDNKSIEYALQKDCETGHIGMNVTFKNTLGMSAPNLTYHCLVPKLKTGETITVNIIIQ
jgi:hypothetical protein